MGCEHPRQMGKRKQGTTQGVSSFPSGHDFGPRGVGPEQIQQDGDVVGREIPEDANILPDGPQPEPARFDGGRLIEQRLSHQVLHDLFTGKRQKLVFDLVLWRFGSKAVAEGLRYSFDLYSKSGRTTPTVTDVLSADRKA